MAQTVTSSAVEENGPASAHAGVASGTRRSPRWITPSGLQIALGAIWLLDGLLQLQGYMYSHAFVDEVLRASAQGQPSFVSGPILTMARLYDGDLALWNTLAAVIQCAIGAGLLVGGRMLKPALALSFGWALAVWWFGEGFGMALSGAPVSPLMGAPGAALLYLLVGLLVWPARRAPRSAVAAGSPAGEMGGRIAWSIVWLGGAVLWLLSENRASGGVSDQLRGMAAGSPHLLAQWQRSVADAAQGHGGAIAVVLAAMSAAIAVGVWAPRACVLTLLAGMLLALSYWVLGQSLGGPFWASDATDPGSGPLLVLLALALMPPSKGVPRKEMGARRPVSYFPGGVRARAGMCTLAPVTLFGLVLLGFPSAFAFTTSGAASPPSSAAMAGMEMGMSPTAGVPFATTGPCTAVRCPIPKPTPNELSVAGELGRAVAAMWVTPVEGEMRGRLELLDANMAPVAEKVRVSHSASRLACGPGCWTFHIASGAETVTIETAQRGRRYTLSLPVRWEQGRSALARELLRRAVTSMRGLPGVRDQQTLTSGPPGKIERIDYRLSAPERMSYTMSTGPRVVIIGSREWASMRGQGWHESAYGGGANEGFRTSNWYEWLGYDQSAQLLTEQDQGGRVTAELALMDPSLPVWFELSVDVGSGLVGNAGMVAGGHFMSDRYSEYGVAQRVHAPSGG